MWCICYHWWTIYYLAFLLSSYCLCLTQNIILVWSVQYNDLILVQFSSIQLLSHLWLFATPWTAACQASLSITNSPRLLKLMSIKSVMTTNHLILYRPLLPSSFPASWSFPMSQFFASGGQRTGVSASASVFPMNIQNWFPLELIGLISLQSKRLSRVFSTTTVQKHQFFSAQLSLWSTLTSIHDYWKNHSFD